MTAIRYKTLGFLMAGIVVLSFAAASPPEKGAGGAGGRTGGGTGGETGGRTGGVAGQIAFATFSDDEPSSAAIMIIQIPMLQNFKSISFLDFTKKI